MVFTANQHQFVRPGRIAIQRASLLPALTLLGLGVVLLAAGVAYLIYRATEISDLDELNVSVSEPSVLPTKPAASATGNQVDPAAATLPGLALNPRYWTDAGATNQALDAADAEAATYRPPAEDELASGGAPYATSIRLPALGVDSAIEELEVVDLWDSRAWETPERIVGHIPITGAPAAKNRGWYFGHLESPLGGEGNVFSQLPNIPPLLRNGESVYIFLEGPDRKYLYEVYKTEVVPASELRLAESGKREITLVACVPRLVYSHRLLVTAKLIGVKDLDAPASLAVR